MFKMKEYFLACIIPLREKSTQHILTELSSNALRPHQAIYSQPFIVREWLGTEWSYSETRNVTESQQLSFVSVWFGWTAAGLITLALKASVTMCWGRRRERVRWRLRFHSWVKMIWKLRRLNSLFNLLTDMLNVSASPPSPVLVSYHEPKNSSYPLFLWY